MKVRHAWKVVFGIGLSVAVGIGLGCRESMPHSLTWPVTGDTVPTHPKPPEGGYHKDWDPYAATIELTPATDVNPVRTQHVLVATVKDKEGKPLPNRRVEWIISNGSVGDIVEVDESGFRASRGYKVDNHFAVSHTNNFAHVLDRGNNDASDDIHLTPGQTWCVVTSPVEGDTHVVAYAPGIYAWDKHKVFAVKHWYDVKWEWPPAATNPTGTTHQFVTKVMKYSDDSPLPGYVVNYKITGGPAGTFDPGGGTTASVRTDEQGIAAVTLKQVKPEAGTNDVAIEIIRPDNLQCCKPAVLIATGATQKIWVAPQIGIKKSAPATAMVNDQFRYDIVVSSLSQVPANEVVVTDTIPDGIDYVSSQPEARVSGKTLTWSLGTMAAGAQATIAVEVKATRTGKFTNCAEVTAAQGLSARDCADTVVTAPALALEKQCPGEVVLCEIIPYTFVVTNKGDGPATNVKVSDTLPDGLTTEDGKTSIVMDVGDLPAGQAKKFTVNVKANKPGQYNNKATATADKGLSAEAGCSTVVRQPTLVVTKTGPGERYVGRPVPFEITVTNNGDAVARDTVLTDPLPAGTEFIEASDGGQFSGGKVTWNLGTLEPNASKKVTVTLRATTRGEIKNTATAQAFCAQAGADAALPIKGVPAILLEVVDDPDPIEVGGNTTYTIEVTNQGSADDTNIVVKCTLPDEEEFVSGDGATKGTAEGKVVTFAPVSLLAPKAKVTFRVVVKGVKEGDVRFKTTMTSDNLKIAPVEETESTHIY
ncbi:MAG: DUF11 domain-containing protein [Phycisphaerae bacterium]|nr:DUF11 domain-containing protein [Phycisphaerae bacterium]